MSKVECMYFTSRNQGSCDILSSTTDNLEVFNDSQLSHVFQANNVIHINEYKDCKIALPDNSDSGFGTGSDDDSLTTSEQSNSPEVSENLESNDFFDFWNRSDCIQANIGLTKFNEINCLHQENSVSHSLNESLLNNEESEMTLTDLLSAIDVENSSNLNNSKFSSIYGFGQVSSVTNPIHEKSTNFESKLDDGLNTCDLFKHIHAQKENDGNNEFTTHDSADTENSKGNTYFTNVSLSDLLESVNFDGSNKSVKHQNLMNSGFIVKEENVNKTNVDFNLDCFKDSNTSLSFINNNDSCLSDMLASISFEEVNSNENYVDTDSCVGNDVVRQIEVCAKKKIPNLLQNLNSSEDKTGEVSLAVLAKKHLSAKLASSEDEIEEVNLTALAEQHLSSSQDSSSSNYITSDVKDWSLFESHDLETESFIELSRKSSVELKLTQTECEYINNSSSMLGLLSSLTVSTEDKYNTNSPIYQYDSENSEFMTVDLTTCLKSIAKTSNNADRIKKDEVDNCIEVIDLSSFHYPSMLSRSPNRNLISISTKAMKCKTNQSLFAKALSSKPKKNFSAMCKVLNLKKNLCNHFFQPLTIVPSEYLTKKAKVAFINQTNNCVTSSCGIRTFSP